MTKDWILVIEITEQRIGNKVLLARKIVAEITEKEVEFFEGEQGQAKIDSYTDIVLNKCCINNKFKVIDDDQGQQIIQEKLSNKQIIQRQIDI